jgi:hypothetical protein
VAEATFGSPAPRFRGLGVAVNLPDDSAGDFPSFAFLQTHSARNLEVLPPDRGLGPPAATRTSDQVISAKSDRAIASGPRIRLSSQIQIHPPKAVLPARPSVTEAP